MSGVMRGFMAHASYVALLFVLCLHGNVQDCFLQNEAVRNQLALSELKSVQSPVQTWPWLKDKLIPSLMPLTDYRGHVMTAMQRRFLPDQDNFRVGPVTLSQYRVRGTCDPSHKILEKFGKIRCVQDYDRDTEETGTFSQGWVPCSAPCTTTTTTTTNTNTNTNNNNDYNDDDDGKEYVYDSGSTLSMAQYSRGRLYGPGGYRLSLHQTRWRALETVQRLQNQSWMDDRTRALQVEVNLFNPNTRLFTQAKVLLEYAPSGGCWSVVSLRSARLYPYVTPWDYVILLLQLIFIVVVVGRLCVILKRICFPPAGSGRCWDGVGVCLLEVLLSLTAIVTYIVRIDRTIIALERIRNQPELFTSWDAVFFLDQVFRVCLSVCLFVRILSFLGPLAFNHYLRVLRQTLLASRGQLYGLALGLAVVLTAYVSFFVLFEGPVTYRLRNFQEGYLTLLTVLLTMTKYNALATEGFDQFQSGVHKVMYGCYCLVAVMIVMNFAITILNAYLSDVKQQTAKAADDKDDLGRFIWCQLGKMFGSCFGGVGPGSSEHVDSAPSGALVSDSEEDGNDNLAQLERKLEAMIWMLTKREDLVGPRLREVHEELHRTRNRLRQVELEAERHRAQLSLLQEKVHSASDRTFNADVSFHEDRIVIRVLDAGGELMYILAWTTQNESPLVTCTASEVTQPQSPGLDLGTYIPVSKTAMISLSSSVEPGTVEIGFPLSPRVPASQPTLGVKFTDLSSWLYLPTMLHTPAFCTEEEREGGVAWAVVHQVPMFLAALTLSGRAGGAQGPGLSVWKRCADCEFSTWSPQCYRDHLALHSTGTVLSCRHPACGSQFLERYKLLKHMQQKHGYPLVCHWCGQGFSSAHALHSHVALHLIKQYRCEVCGQRFHTPQQRNGHRYISHGAWRDAWRGSRLGH
ncbi:polycystin-2-like protein 1 [Babylonia areolata]|uniref:polycystin-2-like protein 1 n=1 Tax=Babylonia areolata TaxID=304850 RepID=UPI003FD449C0